MNKSLQALCVCVSAKWQPCDEIRLRIRFALRCVAQRAIIEPPLYIAIYPFLFEAYFIRIKWIHRITANKSKNFIPSPPLPRCRVVGVFHVSRLLWFLRFNFTTLYTRFPINFGWIESSSYLLAATFATNQTMHPAPPKLPT